MGGFPENQEQIEIVETRVIRRLKVSNLIHSILQVFNIERGWFYTLKHMFVDPGKMALDYIGEGRLKYTPPFRLLFITTTIAFFLFRYSRSANEFTEGVFAGVKNPEVIDLLNKAGEYFNVLIWLYIPIAGFFTWVVNRKSKFNYAENLVFQTYFFVLTNTLAMLIILERVAETMLWSLIITVLLVFYNVFGYKNFFSKSWLRSFLESLALYLFSSTIYFILLIALAVAYIKL